MSEINNQDDIDSLIDDAFEGSYSNTKFNGYSKDAAIELMNKGKFIQRVSENMDYLSPIFFIHNGDICAINSNYNNNINLYINEPLIKQPDDLWAEITPDNHPSFEKQEFYIENRFSPKEILDNKISLSSFIGKDIQPFIEEGKTIIIQTKLIIINEA